MPPTDLFDLLAQVPTNLGDPHGMRAKAAHLDRVAAGVAGLERDISRATSGTVHYLGPAADGFREAMAVRQRQLNGVVSRLTEVRQGLNRAAGVMEDVQVEINGIRRRIEADCDRLGGDADRLVRDARRLANDLRRL